MEDNYFKVSLDTSNFDKQAEQLKKKFDEINAKAGEAGKGIDEMTSGKTFGKATEELEVFEKAMGKVGITMHDAFDSSTLAEFAKNLNSQEEAVERLEEQYKKAKAEFEAWQKAGTGDLSDTGIRETQALATQKKKLLEEINQELQGEKAILKEKVELFDQLAQEVDKLSDKQTNYRTLLTQIRNEMIELEMTGQKGSERYKELEEQMINVATAVKQIDQEQKQLVNGFKSTIDGTIQGLSGLAAAFSVVKGASALFTDDQKRLEQIQTKLQAVMALTIGMQQISNTLQSTSAFRIGVVSKVTQGWTAAQKALNVQLGISTALSSALMLTGIGALIGGVIALVAYLSKLNEKQKENARIANMQKDALREAGLEANKQANEELSRMQMLYKASQDKTRSDKERLRAVAELKAMYPQYLRGYSEEEILAGRAKGAIEALTKATINHSKAKAYAKKMDEANEKVVNIEMERGEKFDDLQKKLEVKEKAVQEASEYLTKLINSDNAKDWQKKNAETVLRLRTTELEDFENTIDKKRAKIKAFKKDEQEALENMIDSFASNIRIPDLLNTTLDPDTEKNYLKSAQEAKEQWEKAKQVYENIQKDQNATNEQVERAKKDLAEKASNYSNKYGGDTSEKPKLSTYTAKADDSYARLVLSQRKALEDAKTAIEREGIEDRLKLIDLELAERIKAIQKEGEELKGEDKKITEERIKEAEKMAQMQKDEVIKSNVTEQQKELENLLKQYEDFEAQKTRIKKEYDEQRQKLEEAKNDKNAEEIERALKVQEEQFQKQMQAMDFSKFKDDIDWENVFGNVSFMGTEALKDLKAKLEEYVSNNAGNLAVTDIKAIQEAIDKIDVEAISRNPFKTLKSGTEEYKAALDKVKEVKEEIAVLDKGTEAYEAKVKELTQAEKNRATALSNLHKSIRSIGEQGSQAVQAGNEVINMFESLNVKIDETVKKSLDGISNIMNTLASADFSTPFSSITTGINMLSGVGKLIGGLFGGGKSKAQKMYEYYDNVVKSMDNVIDRQKKILNNAKVLEAQFALADVEETLRRQRQANIDKMDAWGDTKKRKDSWRKRTEGNMKKDRHQESLKNAGLNISTYQELINLKAEDIAKLKTTTLWSEVLQDELKAMLEDSEKFEEELKAIGEQAKDIVLGFSFDDARNDLKNFLLDSEKDLEDWADNFDDMMNNTIAEIVMGNINEDLMKWRDELYDVIKDGSATEEEIAKKKKEGILLAEQAKKEMAEMKEAWGINDKEKGKGQDGASRGGFETMSQDTASELNGRFTAIQMETVNISSKLDNILILDTERLNMLKGFSVNFQELRTIGQQSMYHLQDISKNTSVLHEMNEVIKKVAKNTDNL